MTVMRAFLLFLAIGAVARPAAADGWTLAAAVDRALSRHPALRASERSVDAAGAAIERVDSAWLPRVAAFGRAAAQGPVPTLTIDTGLTPPGAAGPLEIEREIGQRFTGAIGLEAGWRAWDFGARSAQAAAAEAGVEAARQDTRLQAATLAWSVRQSYAAAAFAAEVQRVTAKTLETTRDALRDAQAGRDVGLSSDVDVAAAATRAAELEARLAAAESEAARAQETLRLLLDAPPGQAVLLVDGLEALARPAPDAGTRPAPSAARLRAAAEARARQREAVDRAFWPTLDVAGSAAWQDPRTFVETEPGLAWMVGAKVTWPFFDGRDGHQHARQLAAESASLRAAAEAADERQAQERADAAARQRAAVGATAAAERRVHAAEVYATAARAAESAGAATHVETERAVDQLDAARLSLAQARFDATRARADRLRADGVAREEER